jgi:putative hydrolase of the HAD superfamily
VFFAVRNDVEVFADVRPALERLRLKYRLLALTNGNADLVAIGLDGFFETCLSARDAGVAKPDRRIFAALLQRVGLAPGQVAYVGDDPVVDVEGARRAGLGAVWMDRFARPWPMDLEPPAHHVRDFDELAGLLL